MHWPPNLQNPHTEFNFDEPTGVPTYPQSTQQFRMQLTELSRCGNFASFSKCDYNFWHGNGKLYTVPMKMTEF
jgi:hypothetical protein